MMLALLLSMAAVFSPAAVEAYSRHVGATVTVETEKCSYIGVLRAVTEESVVIEVPGNVRTINADDVVGIFVSGIERGPDAAFDPEGVRNRRIVELEHLAERKDREALWAGVLGAFGVALDAAFGLLWFADLHGSGPIERKVGLGVLTGVGAGIALWPLVGCSRAFGDAAAARSDIEALRSMPLPTSVDEE